MALPDPVQLAVPIFMALIAVELVAGRWLNRGEYHAGDAGSSLLMGLGMSIEALLSAGLVLGALELLYRWRLFEIPVVWWAWIPLFFAEDLAYYWFHRLSHETRFWWASHVVHHSSQHYNLTTALRQTWTGPESLTFLPWLPLALLGFPPEMILFQKGINLIYQFWIHTELIDRLPPWFEAVMNTPSHHRVHHANNPRYLDANYAGTLIIWDRLFGTFVAEDPAEPCRYGIVKPIGSFNPLHIAFHEWRSILADLRALPDWRHRLGLLFHPPGWRPDGTGTTSAALKAAWRERQARRQV